MSETFHTIILGLGAMGSAAAYHLARRGKRVLGLERFTLNHTLGSSHGETRIIRLAYYEDPAYVPLLRRAYELWQELHAASPEPLLQITGGLMIGEGDATQVVRGATRSAQEHGLPHEILDAAAIRRRFPPFQTPHNAIGLYKALGGVVFPEAAIRAHLRGAAAAGATLRFEAPVTSWEAAPSGRVRVTTPDGVYEAERLIVAAGAYAPTILADVGLPLTVQRNVLYWFRPTHNAERFAPQRCPIFIWELPDQRAAYGFPAFPGVATQGVKIAYHNYGPLVTPETIDRVVHADEVADMRAFTAERMPDIAGGELIATATCMYTLTPDQHFVIDVHPRHPQVLICSPCSGHGYKMASVIGEIMADLAEHSATRHPIALFRADRLLD